MVTTSGAALCTCKSCLGHCDGQWITLAKLDGSQPVLKAPECSCAMWTDLPGGSRSHG